MEYMGSVLNLSLKEMSLRRVAANFWCETDILSEIQMYLCPDNLSRVVQNGLNTVCRKRTRDDDLQDVLESKVKNKVSTREIPENFKKQLMKIVGPIGSAIIKWKYCHKEILLKSHQYIDIRNLKQLHWTCAGTIDYRKTAEKLIRVKVFDVVTLYKLACMYCVIDSIHVLWGNLPTAYKNKLDAGDRCNDKNVSRLENYWALVQKTKQYKLNWVAETSYLKALLKYSACNGYKEATVYVFETLKRRGSHTFLMETASSVVEIWQNQSDTKLRISDVVFYLLTQMSNVQKKMILTVEPFVFLLCFQHSPKQDFFLDMADLTWPDFPINETYQILDCLITMLNYPDYFFPGLFQKFFPRTPNFFKTSFVKFEYNCCSFFTHFFHSEDEESIKVIFRNIDRDDKMKLLCGRKFFQLLDSHIKKDKWDLVELCLCEAALSREDKDRLKLAFTEFLSEFDEAIHEVSEQQWKRFFDFLDENDPSDDDKRPFEEETQTKSKKLCSHKENNLL